MMRHDAMPADPSGTVFGLLVTLEEVACGAVKEVEVERRVRCDACRCTGLRDPADAARLEAAMAGGGFGGGFAGFGAAPAARADDLVASCVTCGGSGNVPVDKLPAPPADEESSSSEEDDDDSEDGGDKSSGSESGDDDLGVAGPFGTPGHGKRRRGKKAAAAGAGKALKPAPAAGFGFGGKPSEPLRHLGLSSLAGCACPLL